MQKFRKIINDISCFNRLFDDLKYLEWYTTKTFDENIESFKEKFDNTYNIIERLEKTNWGGISLKTKELVNKFEEAHKDLCYRVASLKPWGQE